MLLQRTLLLGALAGALIGQLYLLALTVVIGDWAQYPPAALIGGWVAAPAGALDGLIALVAVLSLGPLSRWAPLRRRLPPRRRMPLAALVGGAAAAALPLWITFHAGWPRADGGVYIGIGLSSAAFLAGAVLTWPVLTGRPCLHDLRQRG